MNDNPVRILQITDCHLGQDYEESLLGLKTAESLADVLVRVREEQQSFDLILATGDISNDGTPASYERFITAVQTHFPDTPIAWLEGNHDDPSSMRGVSLAAPQSDYIAVGNWRLILLNSRVPFEERGELQDEELQRLDTLLQAEPDAPTMVFLHHQVVPVGSTWIDQYVVSNADRFFSIIDRYNNVRAVSWGHVHQEFFTVRNGVDLLSTPSTCVQFAPQSDDFMIDSAMPGYRVYDLYPDGNYQTSVGRIAERVYQLDFASSGY